MPRPTIHEWARSAGRRPLITILPRRGREAIVPFIGFAEAYVLSAFRKAGVPLQRIRPAVEHLAHDLGVEHALASEQLYTDGAEVLLDYGNQEGDEAVLKVVVVRTNKVQLSELVRDYLRRVIHGSDGWATRLALPAYGKAEVTVDPSVAFGLPIVRHGGARVEDLVDRFVAGDTIGDIADDFDVLPAAVEDVIRVATRTAA